MNYTRYILTFKSNEHTFPFELSAESVFDAERRGQNLCVVFDAELVDVYPIEPIASRYA